MSAPVAELLETVTAAGLELIPDGQTLRVRGPEPLPGDLLDLLRERKPEVMGYLRDQAERQREAAATDAWERLRQLHLRCGCPPVQAWLTDQVQVAEQIAEAAWLTARAEGSAQAHARALEAIETWLRVAECFVATAAAGGPRAGE